MATFQVALTGDFRRPDGRLMAPDIGLSLLDEATGIDYRYLANGAAEIASQQLVDLDAVLVLSARVTAASLAEADRLLLVARFGVGYDSVDVGACTRAGVILTVTPEGPRRAMALAAITFLLALTHRLLIKDRLTRHDGWNDRGQYFGTGIADKVLGIVGLGSIGREVARLAATLDLRLIAADPWVHAAAAAADGVRLVDLPELLATADFVVVCCPLTEQTFHLIDAAGIARMQPSAYLINVARGPIVDQAALLAALEAGRIAGAGLDVFEQEPISPDDPLLALDNVVLAPHSLGWTDDAFRDNGRAACRGIVDVAAGRVPAHIINPEVLQHPKVRARLNLDTAEAIR